MATSHLKGGQIQQQEQTEKKGEKKGRRDKRRPGRTQKPLMFCFSTGTGLDEIPFIEPCISSSARQQVFVLLMS